MLRSNWGKDPDCLVCTPAVLPNNQEAFQVYMMVHDQYRMGFGGPVALDHVAIWQAIDHMDITHPEAVFSKVITVSRDQISKLHQEMKEKEDGKRPGR